MTAPRAQAQPTTELTNTVSIIHKAEGKRWLILVQELDATESRESGSGKSWTEHTEGQAGKVYTDDQGRAHRIMLTVSTPKTATATPKIEDMTKAQLQEMLKKLQA